MVCLRLYWPLREQDICVLHRCRIYYLYCHFIVYTPTCKLKISVSVLLTNESVRLQAASRFKKSVHGPLNNQHSFATVPRYSTPLAGLRKWVRMVAWIPRADISQERSELRTMARVDGNETREEQPAKGRVDRGRPTGPIAIYHGLCA